MPTLPAARRARRTGSGYARKSLLSGSKYSAGRASAADSARAACERDRACFSRSSWRSASCREHITACDTRHEAFVGRLVVGRFVEPALECPVNLLRAVSRRADGPEVRLVVQGVGAAEKFPERIVSGREILHTFCRIVLTLRQHFHVEPAFPGALLHPA